MKGCAAGQAFSSHVDDTEELNYVVPRCLEKVDVPHGHDDQWLDQTIATAQR